MTSPKSKHASRGSRLSRMFLGWNSRWHVSLRNTVSSFNLRSFLHENVFTFSSESEGHYMCFTRPRSTACHECFFGESPLWHASLQETPCRVQFHDLPPRDCLHPPLQSRSQYLSPLRHRPSQITLHAGSACHECFLGESHSGVCPWETPCRVQNEVLPPRE